MWVYKRIGYSAFTSNRDIDIESVPRVSGCSGLLR